MLKIIIYLLLFTAAILWVGETKIQLWPPKITVQRPLFATGLLVMCIGYFMILAAQYNKGRKQGHQDAIEIMEKKINEDTATFSKYPRDTTDQIISQLKYEQRQRTRLKLFHSKRIIYGCEDRGDADKPYLTRYTLVDTGRWQLCLHVFHRSDWTRDLHDHPWNFLSLILWGGYYEETPNGVKKLYRPGQLLYRKAEHIHRVQLLCKRDATPIEKRYEKVNKEELTYLPRRKAVTLVLMSNRRRTWGFWEPQADGISWSFISFSAYFQKYRC